MPKKKKSLPMTEDEKIAFEEQKRFAEEEMKKKREDVLAQFLKDKIIKEEKATRYNLHRLNYQWRNIMREAKAKDLVKDIEILSQTFERVIDAKDAVIQSLFKDIAEAEEQYSVALRDHLQKVDALIELHKRRLENLAQVYALELNIICDEFEIERKFLVEQHAEEMADIADILFAMEENFEEREIDARAEYQSQRDEIKNKNLEDKHALRVNLEAKIEDYWFQFRQALQTYNEMNEERKNSYENLRQKDEKNTKEIELQLRKLQRISDQISHVRSKIAANARESEEKNRSIKEDDDDNILTKADKEKVQRHFHQLKAQMGQVRDQDRVKLTKLTLESNDTIRELKSKKTKGELIIRLAEMCRKLETEEEKVLPFFASTLTEEEKAHVQASLLEEPTHKLTELMHQSAGLENFWKRHSKVLLDKLSLEKEKQGLSTENSRLRMLLKQYLDGISVNEEILSQVNPLLVVNNKTNIRLHLPLLDAQRGRPVPRTIVEAAHHVKHTLH